MKKILRVGTRTSPLALAQVREIAQLLKTVAPGVEFEIVSMDTVGDRDKKTPISEMEGTDFFTREIDQALLTNQIDLAVHSAKDLAGQVPEGIVIAATTRSVDPYDVLVSKDHLKLRDLPEGAKVGTSSERRKNQLRAYRPDLKLVDIRGTMGERLDKLFSEDLNAIVIAGAGLIRLGLGRRITERIGFDILKPHPLQGSLAVAVRAGDEELKALFGKLDGKKTSVCVAGQAGRKRVLVTGTRSKRFESMGKIIHVPMIEIKPARSFKALDAAILRIDEYDGFLFTSRHAVLYFLDRLKMKMKSVEALRSKMIVAIGKTTAEALKSFGLGATCMPEEETAESMAKLLGNFPVQGKHFLIPRSDLARDLLVDELRKRGALVEPVTVYRNICPKIKKQDLGRIDEIVFTSPSTIRNFLKIHQDIPARIKVWAIGPVTQAQLKKFKVHSEILKNVC
ncbi:MAG: hydroxymethylbilane synthase [Candidatus Omnitrophota bacterium]